MEPQEWSESEPSEREIRNYQARVRKEQKIQQELVGDTSPCLTSDGQRIYLYAKRRDR